MSINGSTNAEYVDYPEQNHKILKQAMIQIQP